MQEAIQGSRGHDGIAGKDLAPIGRLDQNRILICGGKGQLWQAEEEVIVLSTVPAEFTRLTVTEPKVFALD